ncbi:MAG: GDSL-type esterase/lipase family protein [Parvibaculaceae bacterium]|nr:GDSL-type esterase/lipase family protein [Parvibaculaceae bacterium]
MNNIVQCKSEWLKTGIRWAALVLICLAFLFISFFTYKKFFPNTPVAERADCLVDADNDPTIATVQGPGWLKKQKRLILDAQQINPQIVLLGDSITYRLSLTGPGAKNDYSQVFQEYQSAGRTANLGIFGDTSANILWRVQNGGLAGIHPGVLVLLVGANDRHCHWSVEHTVKATKEIVRQIQIQLPDTRIIVEGQLPREGESRYIDLNKQLAMALSGMPHVYFEDLSDLFFQDGEFRQDAFLESPAKALHPSPTGAALIAGKIVPLITRLLSETASPSDMNQPDDTHE